MRDCGIARGHDNLSVLDIVSLSSATEKMCVVLPTLDHAIAMWPTYLQAIRDQHGGQRFIKTSKTSAFMFNTKTLLRLWTPYEREPTQWMDHDVVRAEFVCVTPYSRRDAR